MRSVTATVLFGLSLATGVAAAQGSGQWRVIPSVGLLRYDRTTALSSTDGGISKLWPSVGLATSYAVRPNLHVGLYIQGGNARTDTAYFQPARLRFGPIDSIRQVSQDVIVLQYGVMAMVDLPFARRIGPYLQVGAGLHSIFPDVQQTASAASFSGGHVQLGGGFAYTIGSVGLRLELIDYMWMDFDRADLDPVAPAEHATGVDGSAYTWSKPGLIHNMRMSLGVTFVPGAVP